MSDVTLRERIEECLANEAIVGNDVNVVVQTGRVILRGSVASFAAHCSALRAARRVAGAQNVQTELRVEPGTVDESELRYRARRLIDWNALVPHGAVEADVVGTTLQLRGTLVGCARHRALIDQLTPLSGLTDIVDRIQVVEPGGTSSLPARIRSALQAHAGANADRVRFDVQADGTVRLEGELSDWQCHSAVIEAVQALDGITRVDDAITIDD